MGADDCVTKIPAGGAMKSSLAWMREHILPRLKRAVEQRARRPAAEATPPNQRARLRPATWPSSPSPPPRAVPIR